MSFDIAVRYELGYVADPISGDERFAGMLCIPYLTKGGVQAIKFRNLGSNGPKYDQHHGQEGRLYNASAYFDATDIIGIAEGEMDAISATEHLGVPTLGIPGATSWKDRWTLLLRDFRRVVIFADGDLRGSPAYDKPIALAEKIGWRAQVVRCPEGEDVSSLAAAGTLDVISISNPEEGDDL